MSFLFKFLIFLCLSYSLFSNSNPDSKRVSNWNFGFKYSLNFNPPDVTPTYGSQLIQREGVSSISDKDGNLLFYTNGQEVYDSTNSLLPSGFNLSGHPSSTQSATIIKSPYNEDDYYIFTLDGVELDRYGLMYNVINTKKNNGKGDVIIKNIPLYQNSTEKISSIKSKDGKSVWIITHPNQKSEFLVYELTTTLNIIPKSYPSIFKINTRNDRLGYLKFFAGGTKFATAYYWSGILEYGDFDPSTGKISNIDTLSLFPGIYGVEFSPNGKYVYVSSITEPSYLLQVDLKTKKYNVIYQRSDVNSQGQTTYFGALQVGIDGKIYIADDVKNTLSVINSPNNYLQSCNFKNYQIQFSPDSGFTEIGLPNNTQTYYYKYGTSPDVEICEGLPFTLSCWTDTQVEDTSSTYIWINSNGDTVSTLRTVTFFNSNISQSGKYTVIINNKTGIFKDAMYVDIKEKYKASPDFNFSTIVCDSNYKILKLNLEHPIEFYNIEWSNGEKNVNQIQVTSPGTYSVHVIGYNGCFNKVFSTTVKFSNFNSDNIQITSKYYDLCTNPKSDVSVSLNLNSNYTFTWFNNTGTIISSKRNFTTSEIGMYYVIIKDLDTECEYLDSININFKEQGKFEIILPDTIRFCENSEKIIYPNITNETDKIYLWSTGDSTKNLKVNSPGNYQLTVIDTVSDCIKIKNIYVSIIEEDISFYPLIIDSVIQLQNFNKLINITKQGNFNIYLQKSTDFIFNNGRIILLNSELGLYEDTLIFESEFCGVIKKLPIKIIRESVVNVIIPTVYSNVGDTININIKINSNINIQEVLKLITFKYNKILYTLNTIILNDSTYRITGIITLTNKDYINLYGDLLINQNPYLKISIKNGIIYINNFCIKPLRQISFTNSLYLNFYPNPSNNILNLEYFGNGSKTLKILNYLGETKYKKSLLNKFGTLILNNTLPTGNYILRLSNESNFIDYQILILK